jgi:hypothetical protein
LDRNLPKEELEATLRAQGYKFRALAFAEPESTLPFMTENYFNKEKAEPQAATTKIAYVATESELDANRLLASVSFSSQYQPGMPIYRKMITLRFCLLQREWTVQVIYRPSSLSREAELTLSPFPSFPD